MYNSDDNGFFQRGTDTAATTHTAGCMTFHAQHRHWHFDNFASYALYSLDPAGFRGQLERSSAKTTFCLIDIHRRAGDLAGSPASKYYRSCSKNSTQGLSIGWSDEYTYDLAGQSFDISGLPDGGYCFVSVADPQGQLLELDESNNEAFMRISISGTSVTRHPGVGC